MASAAPYAYITNGGSNTVSVIDTATNTIIANVTVGNGPVGIAVTPDGKKVYVANEGGNDSIGNTVSVIDTATNTAMAPIIVGMNPIAVAVSPDGSKVYVTNTGSNTVSIIDIETDIVTATILIGSGPQGIAASPDGEKVYATNSKDNTTSVIDTATNTVIAKVSVGNGPIGIAVTPNGKMVYVANSGSNKVSVIDAATNTITANVTVGSSPVGVAVTPDGKKVYVANLNDNTTSVIDAATNTITANVTVGSSPVGVAVTPDGKKVYVANEGSNTISEIDTAINKVIATVPVGENPFAFGQFIGPLPGQPAPSVANFSSNVIGGYAPLSVQFTDLSENATSWYWDFRDGGNSTEQNPMHTFFSAGIYSVDLKVRNENGTYSTTRKIYVKSPSSLEPYAFITNMRDNSVSVIDTAVNTIIATVPVGVGPIGVAVTPDGKKVYVANEGYNSGNTVSVIDTTTNTVIANVTVGNYPWGVAVSPDGAKVYVTNVISGTVSVIDTTTNSVTATVDVGISPFGVAVNPTGTKVYVTKTANNNLSVIDTAANNVIGTVPVGNKPSGVGVTPDGKKVYVANMNSNNVSVIDTTANTVVATVDVGKSPFGVAIHPDGKKAYVANMNSSNVSIIDTETDTVVATVDVGKSPFGVAISPGLKMVYVVNSGSNNISVIDATANKVIATLTVGNTPSAFGQFIRSVPPQDSSLPIANFSMNVTSGYHPLSVLFTDLSQKVNSRSWDVNNDGIEDSNETSFVYEYNSAGTYTAKLTASNANGTTEKTATITVNEEEEEHHSSGGGGGGGAGGSPEPSKNVEVTEQSQAFITNGKPIKFDFTRNATCVVYVGFDAKKTVGKTTTIAEQLKNKSTLVSGLPEGVVYKYFNVWVGKGKFTTSSNFENPVVCFKVEKSWIKDKKINQDSIALNRYSDNKWKQLSVKLLNEDNKYLCFTAEIPEFSFFAITGILEHSPIDPLKKYTSTDLTSDANQYVSGQLVTFIASVKTNSLETENLSGNVTFIEGDKIIGVGSGSLERIVFSSSLPVGQHSIIAHYSGDDNFNPSNSSAFNLMVKEEETSWYDIIMLLLALASVLISIIEKDKIISLIKNIKIKLFS